MPMCCKELMYQKINWQKKYQIAHIYPLNPKPEEEELLKNEEKLNADLNHLDNLICLCTECHTKFDKPRTIEGYREMVQIKKNLLLKNKEKSNWSSELIEEINTILEFLASDDLTLMEGVEIEYEPKTIDTKTDDSIGNLTKKKIKANVEEYYQTIKTKFIEIDGLKPKTTELLSTQIKGYYIKMSQIHTKQNDIFEAIVEWLFKKTNESSREACEIIISYFIQSCEIF